MPARANSSVVCAMMQRRMHMLQSRTLLVHGDDGRLTFVHQTVMEWLVGQALAARMKTEGRTGTLNTGRLSDF